MAIESKCPRCKTVNIVGDELIGRYTQCKKCHCRFYVEVPTPDDARGSVLVHESSHLESPSHAGTADPTMSKALGQASNATHRLERQMKQALLGLMGLAVVLLVNTALLVAILAR